MFSAWPYTFGTQLALMVLSDDWSPCTILVRGGLVAELIREHGVEGKVVVAS